MTAAKVAASEETRAQQVVKNTAIVNLIAKAFLESDMYIDGQTPCGEYTSRISATSTTFMMEIFDEDGPENGNKIAEFMSADLGRIIWLAVNFQRTGSEFSVDLDKLFDQTE